MGHFHPSDKLLLHGGSYPWSVKMADVWLLPKDAEKPQDGRYKKREGDKQ